MRLGFTVSVKEISNDLTIEQPKKIDPDEFFTDKAVIVTVVVWVHYCGAKVQQNYN